MIPNYPNFSTDFDYDPIRALTSEPLPPRYNNVVDSMVLGGRTLDDKTTRADLVYWSVMAVGTGAGSDSNFEFRYWDTDTSTWIFDRNYDVVFLDATKLRKMSVAFDRSNRPVIVFEDGAGITLNYYDTRVSSRLNIESIAGTHSPYVFYDAPYNPKAPGTSVLLLYVRDDTIFMRTSDDHFVAEESSGLTEPGLTIHSIGFTEGNALQVRLR